MRRVLVNECRVKFPSLSRNEGLSRSAAAAFVLQCDPTVEETAAVKTAVSEAVTNAIVHGYRNNSGDIELMMRLYEGNILHIQIRDKGSGIADVAKAMEPAYTTAPEDEERSGFGFTVMASFMDKVSVRSECGKGTVVTMEKQIFGKRDHRDQGGTR